MGFFNSPLAFGFCLTILLLFQAGVGVYIAGVLTTLQQQYRLNDFVSGLIIATSDIASLVSVVAVTYIGQHGHRPRIIGILGLMVGLGGILSGLPHFFHYRQGELRSGNSTSTSCDDSREELTCTADQIDSSGSRITELWALLIGQALMGLAYGPLFPLAITYLDDQVRGTTTPYFISAFFSAGSASPLIGFVQGFIFLQMFVNWPWETNAFYKYKWIGAWWIGFILDGIILIIISIPFFFFPKKMDLDIDENLVPEEKKNKDALQPTSLGLKDFFTSARRLVTNFVWVTLTLGTISELAVAACFGFFMPKFIEVEYKVTPAVASLFMGIVIAPAAFVGYVVSGVVIKKLDLDSKGCGKLLVFLAAVGTIFVPTVFFLTCPEASYANLNSAGVIDSNNNCNEDCQCPEGIFEPVCGSDGLTYPTPCFAGCTGEGMNMTDDPNTNITIYTGCKCSSAGVDEEWAQQSLPGECRESCGNILYFVGAVLAVNVVLGSCSKNPLLILQMRCVDDSDKAFGLGLNSLFGRALGFLPAPLYIGAAIGSSCMLDRIECGVTGDCFVYDDKKLRVVFLSILIGLSVFSLVCFILAAVRTTMLHNRRENEKLLEESLKGEKQVKGADNKAFHMEKAVGKQTNLSSPSSATTKI